MEESRSEFYKKTYGDVKPTKNCEYSIPRRSYTERASQSNKTKNGISKIFMYCLAFFTFIYLTDGKLTFSTIVAEKTRIFIFEELRIEDRLNDVLSNFTEQTITINGEIKNNDAIIDENVLQEMNLEIEQMNKP